MMKKGMAWLAVASWCVAVGMSYAGTPETDAAWALYYAGDYAKAVEKFNAALASKKVPEKEVWAVHSGLGWAYYWKGDVKMAEREFKDVLKDMADNADALKGLAFCQFRNGDFDGAIESSKKSLKLVPSEYVVMDILAMSYFKKKDVQNAKKEFEKVIDMNLAYVDTPEFGKVLEENKEYRSLVNRAGWGYFWAKNFDAMVNVFTSVVAKDKEDWDALMGLGYAQYQFALYDKAIPNLEFSLRLKPESKGVKESVNAPGTYGLFWVDGDAKSTLAWCYYNKKEYDKAIKLFQEVLKAHPDWLDSHDGLGWCYMRNNMKKEAEESFNKALKINKDYASSLQGLDTLKSGKTGPLALAFSYYNTLYYDLALVELKNIVDGKVEFPKEDLWKVHNLAAWCHQRKGMYKEAIKSFKASVDAKDKDNEDSHMGLGFAYYYSADYPNAAVFLQKGVSKRPTKDMGWTVYSDAISALGWSHFLSNNYDGAVKTFKALVQFQEGNDIYADPHNGLGWCYLKQNQTAEAKKEFEKALALVPGYLGAMDGMKQIQGKDKKQK